MLNEIISTSRLCMDSVQLKLPDYFYGEFNLDRAIYDRLKPEKQSRYVDQRFVFFEWNRFEMVNPIRPNCNSHKVTK
jgi:hypothetical protein